MVIEVQDVPNSGLWLLRYRMFPLVDCGYCIEVDYWTGLLDSPKMMQNAFFSLFQCRREANHVYSAYLFAKFAPLAC